MDPNQQLKDYGIDKISKLEKYLDSVLDAEITFTLEKFRHRTAVVLTSDGLKIKAEQESEDMFSSVDLVVDKLERQIKRHRERLKEHKPSVGLREFTQEEDAEWEASPSPGGNGHDESEADSGAQAARTLDLPLVRMTPEEASQRLSLSPLPFLVYLDEGDGGVRLLRHSGGGSLELVRFHRQAD
jgi:putative sigma-54 modulation protein